MENIPEKFICLNCIDDVKDNDDLGAAYRILRGSDFENQNEVFRVPQLLEETFVADFLSDDKPYTQKYFKRNGYFYALNFFIRSYSFNGLVPITTVPNSMFREDFLKRLNNELK